jgi:chaperone required for assembly of F1-ATPase
VKRFYTTAVPVPAASNWAIELDGRAVLTPRRAALLLPTARLATAIAAEWSAQRDTIDARTMPLAGIANAAIDHVAPDPAAFATSLAAYAESDLVCYRAASPADLAARQAREWDPIVAFIRRRYDADLRVTAGIAHVAQPAASVDRLGAALRALDPFRLAALQPVVTIAGSLAIGLALLERSIDSATAFAAGQLDELYQAEQWGDDDAARAARAARQRDFDAAARFLSLL